MPVTSNSEKFVGEIPLIPNAPFDVLKNLKNAYDWP